MKDPFLGLLAADGQADSLLADVVSAEPLSDRLFLVPAGGRKSPWVQNVWEDPRTIEFRSISDAAAKLRALQRNWVLFPTKLHRRAQLIQESLPHITFRPFVFGDPLPRAPLGSWTLIDQNVLIASPKCSSPFPNGELHFAEDKVNPPSRAYLKLWEAFTLLERRPAPGELCLDAGASPGGWSWVLRGLGATVIAVDRSPLAPELMKDPLLTFVKGDAFSRTVAERGSFDWIFSDVACFPERLYEWVQEMLILHPSSNFICTIKFQDRHGHDVATKFAQIAGSRLMHLFHNKHELTWVRLTDREKEGAAAV